MNNNSLAKLLYDVEPKIKNIEENRIELKSLKDVYDTISELISNSERSYDEILDFYDQDFIIKAIKIGNSNANEIINKYNTSRYLLKNKDPNLQELPQFKEAINFIQFLYQYLYGLYQEIQKDYEDKEEKLRIKELLNKYYNLLNKDNIFIKDVDEFLTFIDLNKIDIIDRINILIDVNKSNIKNYTITNDIVISNNIKLSDIKKLIEANQDLLNQEILQDKLDVELNKYIENNNIDENMFANKKIYLIQQINKLYNINNYSEIIPKYLEFDNILKIEKEFSKQKNRTNKLVFLKDNDKSLISKYLERSDIKAKNCILKNLIDIENNKELEMPIKFYKNIGLYVKDEFIVKTIYTYLANGDILIISVLENNKSLEDYINDNEELLNNSFENIKNINSDSEERDKLLKDIKIEDLVLNIDLDTLDVKREV